MPNIASVLKDEIIRLTRKEFRQQMEPLRKQVLAQRRAITSLKSEVDKLQRGIKAVSKGARKSSEAGGTPTAPTTKVRFSAAGLRKLREKFGLSREAFAPLLGISSQTVYSWEQASSRPRPEAIEKIVILRSMSKRQVLAILEQHASSAPKRRPGAVKKAAKKVARKSTVRAKRSATSISPAKAAEAA